PARPVIQGGWGTAPGWGDPFRHQAVIQRCLFSDPPMTMHHLSEPQTPPHRHGAHQRANRPRLTFHLMQLYSHGSTSMATGNGMLPFSWSSNPRQKVRDASLKKVMHRGWAYFQARLAFTMAAFNVLVQWHGFQPNASGFVPLSIAEFSL